MRQTEANRRPSSQHSERHRRPRICINNGQKAQSKTVRRTRSAACQTTRQRGPCARAPRRPPTISRRARWGCSGRQVRDGTLRRCCAQACGSPLRMRTERRLPLPHQTRGDAAVVRQRGQRRRRLEQGTRAPARIVRVSRQRCLRRWRRDPSTDERGSRPQAPARTVSEQR